MPTDRREFLNFAATGIATGILALVARAPSAMKLKIKAIAFDAFPVFDPRPVFALAEQLINRYSTASSEATGCKSQPRQVNP